MAFPMIETGYKPEFSLGALYQGENAAAAQNAQTQEIIQQALENIQKQVSFPIAMDKDRAQTNLYDATAEKYRREPQENNMERMAKAEQLRKVMQDRSAGGYLQTALQMAKMNPDLGQYQGSHSEYLDQLVNGNQLPQDIIQRLRPSNTNLYTNENISNIITDLQRRDPEYGKYTREDLKQSGAMDRKLIDQEIAADRERNRLEIERKKAEVKEKLTQHAKTIEAQYVKDLNDYRANPSKETKAKLFQSRESLERLKTVARLNEVDLSQMDIATIGKVGDVPDWLNDSDQSAPTQPQPALPKGWTKK